MSKKHVTLGTVHTGLLAKKRKTIVQNSKSIIIAIILLLLCFNGTVQAREELPSNLIEEKDIKINEIILGATEGFTLTAQYISSTKSVQLSWNAMPNMEDYIIYQQINGETERVVETSQKTSITVNNIVDRNAPNVPKVTNTLTADKKGNNLNIQASTDNGTTYRHRVEGKVLDIGTIDVVFVQDYSKSMRYWAGNVKSAMIEIGYKFIDMGARVAATTCGGYRLQFTKDKATVRSTISGFGRTSHTYMDDGIYNALSLFRSSTAKNKILIAFGDLDDFPTRVPVSWLESVKNQGIKFYVIQTGGTNQAKINVVKHYGEITSVTTNTYDAIMTQYNNMYNKAVDDMIPRSNTVSTTATSGIKGYKYAVTTSINHTFSKNDPIVQIKDIPKYITGENLQIQYFHIVAIDNELNQSPISTTKLQVPRRITLKTTYKKGMNYVPLNWKINDPTPGYTYSLFRKEIGDNLIESVETQIATITDTTTTLSYTMPGTYYWTVPEGITELKVAVAGGGGRRCSSIR